ncbi:MAG: YcxB family protein [Lachnospiraceae bacterium]|nr:YcxB family protein [Lachnospiraceae bacterium]
MGDAKRSFTFKTKPTVKELWKFSMYFANKGLRGGVNIILVGGSLFLLLTRWSQLEMFQRLMLFFIIFLFVIWQPAMLYPKCLRQAKELEKQPPLILTFSEEGVEVSQGEEGGHIEWKDVGKIEAVGGMMIVYGDRVHASLIPISSMGADEEGFRKLVREKLPKARCRRI